MPSLDWPAAVHGGFASSEWIVAELTRAESLSAASKDLPHDSTALQEGRNTDSDSEIELHDVYPDART